MLKTVYATVLTMAIVGALAGLAISAKGEVPVAQVWEYKLVEAPRGADQTAGDSRSWQAMLSANGAEGWEVVQTNLMTVEGARILFKRAR